MSQQRYTLEFKDEAVRHVTEKGHSVQEVAALLSLQPKLNAAYEVAAANAFTAEELGLRP